MRHLPLLLVFFLVACGEEETGDDITALAPLSEARPAPVAEAPSPAIVQPHVRPSNSGSPDDAERRSPSGGSAAGAGRGGGDWAPSHARAPSAREVEQFRRRLEREVSARVDGDDDPCKQYDDVMRAAAAATGTKQRASSRAATRERCRQFSETMQRCMSPAYFQQNIDECNAEMVRLGRDGERMRARAQRQWEAIERAERAARRAAEEEGG